MATESTDGSDVTVSLPPSLEEWIEDRAEALGVDREELLVQVAGAYRAAADLADDDVGAAAHTDAVSEQVEAEVRAQLQDLEADDAALAVRIDELEEDLNADRQSLRNRMLQLRDAVRNRAKTDHAHEEFSRLADRLDAVATDVADLSEALTDLEADIADADAKLDTLARVVLELRSEDGEATSDRRRHLETLRETANRSGVTEANCSDCGESVSIPLLTEPACPHCEAEFRDVTTTGIVFRRSKLTGPDPGSDSQEDADA